MRIAVGILFLGSLEAEIHLGAIYPPPFNTNVSKIAFNMMVTKITVFDTPG